jgi:hypothetical protein
VIIPQHFTQAGQEVGWEPDTTRCKASQMFKETPGRRILANTWHVEQFGVPLGTFTPEVWVKKSKMYF